MRPLLLSALLCSFTAFAGDDFNTQNMAKIQAEQAKANDAIDKKYGNKKQGELTPDERRAMQKEKSGAERAVLDQHGVDAKSYAKAGAKMNREDRAATDAAAKEMEKQDSAAKAPAADAKKGGKKEIVIEKNGQGQNPDPVNEAAEMDKAAGLGKGKSKK